MNLILAEADRRRITRLCHFTPVRNLVHIATGGDGLLSTKLLSTNERKAFNQQDLLRLDNHPDHICCSIEYPNAWHFRSRSADQHALPRLFKDWVVLFISRDHLWAPETLFCPCNAATGGGRLIAAGCETFLGLFADSVEGARGQIFSRTPSRLTACPTSDQAEVLIHRQVPIADITHVVVRSVSAAKRVLVQLDQLRSTAHFTYVVCPEFFNPPALSQRLQSGMPPIERTWNDGEDADA